MKSANGFIEGNIFVSVGTFHPLAKRMCHILDYLDWPAAEQECRAVRAVGFFHP
jgi:hypothetical protein